LYGDSTPSNLEGNYIEFLRDAVEFCVQVLLSDQRIAQGKAQTRSLEHATVAEVERLQKLGPLVTKAFEGTPMGAGDSPTARCAAAISKSASDLVRAEAIRMRDALDAEIAKRDAFAAQEREGCVKALEALVVKHDLPGAVFDVLFSKEAPWVRMVRIGEQPDAAAEQPFDVDDDDARKLIALQAKLIKAAADLAGHRRRVLDAKLDGEAMRTHAKPTLLAERLIANMAPVVQEISARSHSPGELILRKLLSGDRREEIFLSKAELKLKLDPLTDGNRALFDPLWASPLPPAAVPVKAAASESAP